MPTAKFPLLLVVGSWLALSLVLPIAPADAGTGQVLTYPLPGKKIKNGARMEIDTNWVGGVGYRPVKVTIINSPLGPTTYDRDFRVVLRPHGIYSTFGEATAEKIVEMPEGSTSGSAWISVPQSSAWQSLDVEVYEGGYKIPELSDAQGLRIANIAWNAGMAVDALPSVLFIDSDVPSRRQRDNLVQNVRIGGNFPNPTYTLPDVRQWLVVAPVQFNNNPNTPHQMGGKIHDGEQLRIVDDNEMIELLPPDELPETWLDYTCLDLIVISLADAQALAEKYPQRWEAILKWAANGCSLVIYDVGEDLAKLAEVEKLCTLQPRNDEDADAGWREADTGYAHRYLRALQSQIGIVYDQSGNPITPPSAPQAPTNLKGRPFAIHPLMLGRVAAMSSEQPLGDPPIEMMWLMNQLEGRNWINYQRNGYSAVQDNTDFVNFLVAGTGRVPVFSFLVLISLFSIVIGPVNYLFLKRWRRLYLLLVTVPLGAILVTAGLFSYALISDGLGVRLRARSYTRLDQKTGRSSTWARQSYYAGLAPSGGLRFPTDAAVYVVDERPTGGSQRERVWNDEQQLRRGYISSRRTAQFLIQTSTNSAAKLEVKNTAGQPPRVVNLLGAPIAHLVLRDQDGEYYIGSNIAPDQEVSLTGSNLPAGLKPFTTAYFDAKPAPPDGYQMSEYDGNLWGFDRTYSHYYMYAQGNQRGLPNPSFSTSIIETQLQRVAQNSNVAMPKNTYRALLTTSPEMPIGYGNARERGSLHVLEGRW